MASVHEWEAQHPPRARSPAAPATGLARAMTPTQADFAVPMAPAVQLAFALRNPPTPGLATVTPAT